MVSELYQDSCRNSLSEENHEKHLQNLAIEAQKYPDLSGQRRLMISQLVNEIWRSPKLGHPQKGYWSDSFYTEIYHEALQKTLLEVCQRIELYNPHYPVMAWINFRLGKQFINVVNDYRKKGITDIPKAQQKEVISVPNLDNLSERLSVSESDEEGLLLRQFIQQEPERLLRTEFMKDRPEISCQMLAKAKFIQDRSWSEIADECKIAPTTICSFFYRRLKKMTPYFKKYLSA